MIGLLVVILLSLVGYSAGAAARSRPGIEPKPRLSDLFIVPALWAGLFAARSVLDLGHLALLPISVLSGFCVGYAVRLLTRETTTLRPRRSEPGARVSGIRGVWGRWASFSRRMGSFQSRLLLSFFYFLVVSPFALAIKLFSDPLHVRRRSGPSLWTEKAPLPDTLEDFKRQF